MRPRAMCRRRRACLRPPAPTSGPLARSWSTRGPRAPEYSWTASSWVRRRSRCRRCARASMRFASSATATAGGRRRSTSSPVNGTGSRRRWRDKLGPWCLVRGPSLVLGPPLVLGPSWVRGPGTKNGLRTRNKGVRTKVEAILALEDGTFFRGAAAGAEGVASGEVVFNTAMTGYQEVLTDPSYAGQIVTMTCPQIGNYGVSVEDVESRAPQVAGFIIRDESPMASNWRSEMTLYEYLVTNHIVAISDIDTRELTRRLRSGGVMRGVIATGEALDPDGLVERARAIPQMEGSDLVRGVTAAAAFDWPQEDPDAFGVTPGRRPSRRMKIAAYDFGLKRNILRRLSAHGCDVRVYPAATPASELLATG